MAGKQRVVGRGDPDRDDHECGEDRFGDEELRHPLDVAEDPAALGDHRRDRGKVAVDEHDVGDGLGHLRSRALRDREARRLQRRDVVDAIPDHRHVTAVTAQRLDDPPLSLRRDATHDRQRGREAGRARASPAGAPRRRAAAREPGCRRPSRSSPRSSRRRRRGRRPRRPARADTRSSPRVSGRNSSARIASPSVRSADGPASGSAGKDRSLIPKPTTRRPASWFAAATAASSPSGKSSGAPSTKLTPPITWPLHRRRERNGTVSSTGSAVAGKAAAIAFNVGFRASEEAA